MSSRGADMMYQRLSANSPVTIRTDRLWEAWAKSGLKKIEFAKAVGVHRATIRNWLSSSESEKVMTAKQVRAISRSCNCSIGYLLGLNDKLEITSEGKALRYLRIKKGLTQRQLADKVFTNQNSICIWETEKAPIPEDMAKILANYFGVTLSYLRGEKHE